MTLNENLNSKWKVSIRCICRNVAYVISSLPLSCTIALYSVLLRKTEYIGIVIAKKGNING